MIFSGNFLVSHCRKFYTGIFKCFIDFGDRKTLCIRGVGHDFLSEYFVPRYQKISWGNPSVFQNFSGIGKIYG